MSGGEQQLLEMAMAVLRRPKILLVDEPSVGLSPTGDQLVFNELQRLHAGGQTILLVEQNTRKAMEVAERAVMLRLGKVIWDGQARGHQPCRTRRTLHDRQVAERDQSRTLIIVQRKLS